MPLKELLKARTCAGLSYTSSNPEPRIDTMSECQRLD